MTVGSKYVRPGMEESGHGREREVGDGRREIGNWRNGERYLPT